MKKILFLLTILITFDIHSSNIELFHRVKIQYENILELNELSTMGICLDHGIHTNDKYFETDLSQSEVNILNDLNINFSIEINDVSQYYRNINNPNHKDYISGNQDKNSTCDDEGLENYETPENYVIKDGNDFGGFYTYSEMLEQLDLMHQLYPSLISSRNDVKDINLSDNPHPHQTYEGRYLQYVKISDNPNLNEEEPQILYTAIHHAREPASLQQLIFYMWYLLENYEESQEVRDIVNNTELYFIPCVNPDGYIFNEIIEPQGGGMWRKNKFNDHGVDNNRNYSYIDPNGNEVWNTAGTSNDIYGQTYAGTGPFSESENRAIKYFVEQNNFKIALNNHTYSNLLLYPFGYDYDQLTEDNETFESISEFLVMYNGYQNILSSDLYPAAGDSDDFMYGMLNTESGEIRDKIFAMTPEIGSSFWPAASTIESICKEMMFLNLNAARMVSNYAVLTDLTENYIDGNSFEAEFNIQRLGLGENGNFNVTFLPVSNNILNEVQTLNFEQMELGESINSFITVNLTTNIQNGDEISYKLILNNGFFDKEYLISKTYGSYFTLFNGSDGTFSNNWDSDSWEETNEEYYSPSTSITDSANINYSNNENSTITILNEIDLNNYSYAEINFKAKWEIQNNFDYVQLEISTDGGSTWIPQCGNHTQPGGNNHQNAFNEPLYTGNQYEWIDEKISLMDYINSSILLRFKIITNGFGRRDGFYFDDFQINGVSNQLSLNNDLDNSTKVYPNPVNNILNIKTNITNYNIKLYDITGKLLINTYNKNSLDLSTYELGIYILKISNNNFTESFKIIK